MMNIAGMRINFGKMQSNVSIVTAQSAVIPGSELTGERLTRDLKQPMRAKRLENYFINVLCTFGAYYLSWVPALRSIRLRSFHVAGMTALVLLMALPALAASKKAPQLPTEKPQHYELNYQIYGGGMHAIDAAVNIDINKRTYQGELRAETRGTIGDLFPWNNQVTANGLLKGRNLQPAYHHSANSWFGKARSVTLSYNPDGSFKQIETTPTPAQDKRDPVAPELTTGTVDILSGALTFLQRTSLGESCNQKIPIFDGRRRFNLVITEVGYEDLQPNHYGFYSGRAKVCDLSLERVAGFWKQNQAAWTEDGDARLRLTFWLAQLEPGGKFVPVKARSYGEFGTAFAHLYTAKVNGTFFAPPAND